MLIQAELQDLRNENRTLVRANREMNKQIDEAKEMRERMVAFVGGSSSIQPEPVKRERVEEEEQDSGFPMGTSAGRQIKRAKTYDLTGDN